MRMADQRYGSRGSILGRFEESFQLARGAVQQVGFDPARH
jgi:hypothetical protein